MPGSFILELRVNPQWGMSPDFLKVRESHSHTGDGAEARHPDRVVLLVEPVDSSDDQA